MPLILAKLRDALFLPRPPSSATLRALQFVGALRTACSNGSTPTKDFLNSPRSLKNPSATADYSPPLRYPWLAANAWACRNNIILGQFKTDEKSNEITAIPELLKVLDLKGNIVTIDAMGCQKKIAQQIIEQGGDYVFNLKGNQSSLHDDVVLFFKHYFENQPSKNEAILNCEIVNGDHGRIETRRYWITEDIAWLSQAAQWRGLKSIGLVEYESANKNTGEVKIEQRCFIASLPANAKQFSQAVRLHWGVESMHWCLDVGFREDDCRVRKDHAPENLAVIRQIALNLLKQEKSAKVGIQTKRLMAGWDHSYLAKLLECGKIV